MEIDKGQDDVFTLLAEQVGRLTEAVEKLAAFERAKKKKKFERAKKKKKWVEEEKQIATTPKIINSLNELVSGEVVYSITESGGRHYDKVFFKEFLADWVCFEDVTSGEEIKLSNFGFNSILDKPFIIYVFPYKQIGYKSETGWENET